MKNVTEVIFSHEYLKSKQYKQSFQNSGVGVKNMALRDFG